MPRTSIAPHFVTSRGVDTSDLKGGYETIIRQSFSDDIPFVVERAQGYLTEAAKEKPSDRRLDKAAKKLIEVAMLQPNDYNDPNYTEAVASNLIEPYDEDRKTDRQAMARIMARDIVDGRIAELQQVPEHPAE